MALEITQISLLAFIALLGIPGGYFLAKITKEEMKDGRKLFKILSVVSLLAIIVSYFTTEGDNLALLLTTFTFIFFISVVPLVKKIK